MGAQVDVLVVGAGLAGLAAARHVVAAGRQVLVLEAAEAVGGRVRTDRVGGLLLDRGFQVLNPAYPQLRRDVDLDALDLHSFPAGVAVRVGDQVRMLAHPLRHPARALGSVTGPGGWRAKAALARWAVEVGYGPARRVRRGPDRSLADELAGRGITGETEQVVRRYLAGVLAEAELQTSRRFGEMLVRSFVRGRPGLPAAGMQALPEQLAARLPPDAVRLNSPVRAVADTTVATDDGPFSAATVIVATDPSTAARLTGLPAPVMKPLSTFYHLCPSPLDSGGWLHLDLDDAGPIVNTIEVTAVAPSYSTSGSLVASTVLGPHDAGLEPQVRAHAARLFGRSARDWEFVAVYPILEALPAHPPGQPLQQPVTLGAGRFVAGDHRDTASVQGALVSGHRAARAALAYLNRVGGR